MWKSTIIEGDHADDETLIGDEVVKEIEIEEDDESGDEDGVENGTGKIKRKRTIRVIIRSRAFL